MACVPGIVTPVPPLDPNAINIFIEQTSNAAFTKTAAAMPTPTFTITFTPTPRNTLTPEASFTPFQTFVLPSVTPSQRLQYFRVKHDTQLAEYDYKPRTAAESWPVESWGWQTPEVVSLFVSPNIKSGTNRTVLDHSWEVYIDALNDHDKRKLNYLKRDNTALFDGKGFPYLESKTTGGNVVAIDKLEGNWGLVHTLDFKNPGTLSDIDYSTRPDLVQEMVVVKWNRSTQTASWIHPPPGVIYWPLVSDKPVWIPLEYLEPFPVLPDNVTAIISQDIRKTPSIDGELNGFEFSEGENATIIEYHLSGSNVWGRLSNGRWIALFLYPKYFTSWSMATLPPPP